MNDDDQTELPAAELPTVAPDTFAALAVLIALVADPKSCGARLRSLQEHQAAAAKATAELTTARAAFDRETATTRAEFAAERALLNKRRLVVHQDELAISEAGKHMAELIREWKFVGESDPLVLSGLRDCQHLPLQKAKDAFATFVDPVPGGEDDDDQSADGRELHRSVDGVPFPPNTTITRDVAVRVRSRSQRARAHQ